MYENLDTNHIIFHFMFLSDLADAAFLFAYDESGKVGANEVGACIRY